MDKGLLLDEINTAGATPDGEMAAVGLVADGEPFTLLVPRELQGTFEAAVATAIRMAGDNRRAAFRGDLNAAAVAPPEMLPTKGWTVLVHHAGEKAALVLRLELSNELQYNFPLELASAEDLAQALLLTAAALKNGEIGPPTLQ